MQKNLKKIIAESRIALGEQLDSDELKKVVEKLNEFEIVAAAHMIGLVIGTKFKNGIPDRFLKAIKDGIKDAQQARQDLQVPPPEVGAPAEPVIPEKRNKL